MVIAEAWKSDEFLAQLAREPARAFSQYGLHPPPHLKISVHIDTNNIQHIIARQEWLKYGNEFVGRLKTEPKVALESIGFNVKNHISYNVLFNTANHMNIVIPRKPSYFDSSVEKIR